MPETVYATWRMVNLEQVLQLPRWLLMGSVAFRRHYNRKARPFGNVQSK